MNNPPKGPLDKLKDDLNRIKNHLIENYPSDTNQDSSNSAQESNKYVLPVIESLSKSINEIDKTIEEAE
jgi:hypothetical protein